MIRFQSVHMSSVRFPLLLTCAVLICAGIFALVPLLLRQTSHQMHLNGASYALLIPLRPEPPPDTLDPEREPEPPPESPEPPEPEIETQLPDIPEIEPPELEPPEMKLPELAHELPDVTPTALPSPELPSPETPQVRAPSLQALSVSALPLQSSPLNLKVNLRTKKVPVPGVAALPAVLKDPGIPQGRFGMNEVDQKPIGIGTLKPQYPYRAKRRGIEGYVTVQFLVDRKGEVHELTILTAQPKGVFEKVVRRTVPKWKFKPGKKAGRPVDTWVEMTIRFQLGDDA